MISDILCLNIIGKKVTIIDSKNKTYNQLKGTIIDETKNTINIDNKLIFKNTITLKIDNYIIDGKLLIGRNYERIKKNLKIK